jgi:zinc/manganese transport system substrate-binding protein
MMLRLVISINRLWIKEIKDMGIKIRQAAVAVSVAAAVAVLVGCGSSGSTSTSTSATTPSASAASGSGSSSGASSGGSAGPISVVASTNVWGDVVKQIGGDQVDVLSIISDPSADPHSYEANAQTQLALSKADLVVENGGGYDDFVDTMLAAVTSKAQVINAVDVAGKAAAAGEELNEHVWYDFPTVDKVGQEIATQLTALDPAREAEFTANAKTFSAAIAALTTQVEAVKATHTGVGVAITEPVPLYLLEAAGLENLTPAEFSEAIEQDTDVPPAVLQETLALFIDRKVKALFYNEQTTGAQTEAVLDAATTNAIAVVPVRETLPEGQDYLTWMQANVAAMAQAVGG